MSDNQVNLETVTLRKNRLLYRSQVNVSHVTQIVHEVISFFKIELDPGVESRDGIPVEFPTKDMFQTRGSLDSTSSIVKTHPDSSQILLEHLCTGVSQTFVTIKN